MPGIGDENPLQDARRITFPQKKQQKPRINLLLITFQYNF